MSEQKKASTGNPILVYLVGGVIGGLLGVFAAKVLLQRAESENKKSLMSMRDGAQLGSLLVNLLRGLSRIGGR